MNTRRRKQNPVHVTLPAPIAARQFFGKRVLVMAAKSLLYLGAVGSALYAGAYALEKWNDTVLAIDLSGDVDQKRPFTLPISLRNPSDLFTAGAPLVICHFQVMFTGSKYASATETGHEEAIHLPDIIPGHNALYSCPGPDRFVIARQADSSILSIKIAHMQVYVSYNTWLLWPISRLASEQFTLFPTSGGYRWVKGQYTPLN